MRCHPPDRYTGDGQQVFQSSGRVEWDAAAGTPVDGFIGDHGEHIDSGGHYRNPVSDGRKMTSNAAPRSQPSLFKNMKDGRGG